MNAQRSTSPSPPFTWRLALGFVGVLIAALASGLNGRVIDIALADVRAGIGVTYDQASWFTSAYQAAEVVAMMIAPWFAVTFSLRKFALGCAGGFMLCGILLPLVPNAQLFLFLRTIQGLFSGALPPLLMTVALRFMPPSIKLYGLGAYALTATFGPNVAPTLAAFWTDDVGWMFMFWQVVPAILISMLFIGWGLPQDPIHLDRFKQLDLFGMLTGCSGMAFLIIAITQGGRVDWFESSLFNGLFSTAIVCLTIFLINEWFHPLPLFKLQMLERSNFSYGLMALAVVLLLALAGSALPSNFFSKVEGFRPAQFAPLALAIGLPQLIITPLVAALLSLRWVDCRWVIAFGIALMIFASLMGMQITSDWARQNFWTIQVLQAIGLPSIILPLLMSATSVVAPPEGHYASAMFNTVRGFASIAAGVLVEWFINHREQFHSNVLVNNVANRPWLISTPVSEQASSSIPLLNDGSISNTENIAGFITLLKHQAIVLSLGDSYLLMIVFAFLLLLITVWLPKRVWPPQIRFQPSMTK